MFASPSLAPPGPDDAPSLLSKQKNKFVVGTTYARAFQASLRSGGGDPLTLPLFEAAMHALPQMYGSWGRATHATIVRICCVSPISRLRPHSAIATPASDHDILHPMALLQVCGRAHPDVTVPQPQSFVCGLGTLCGLCWHPFAQPLVCRWRICCVLVILCRMCVIMRLCACAWCSFPPWWTALSSRPRPC